MFFFLKEIRILLFREKIYLWIFLWIFILLYFSKLFLASRSGFVTTDFFPVEGILWMTYLLTLPVLYSESGAMEYRDSTYLIWFSHPDRVYFLAGKSIALFILSGVVFLSSFLLWYLFFEYEILATWHHSGKSIGTALLGFLPRFAIETFAFSVGTPFFYYISHKTTHPYLYGKIMMYILSLWLLMITG